MDPRERYPDDEEIHRTANDALQAQLWTALPGIIQSFNAAAMTVVVQPAIMGTMTDEHGVKSNVSLPVIPDVPVVFPGGGGFTLTFPIAAGDECWLSFGSRCIDFWWQNGGVQKPVDSRMHDLSDAVAHVGIRSKAKAIGGISTSKTQLRSNDGATLVELDGAGHVVTVTAPTGIVLNSPSVTVTGALNVQGTGSSGAVCTITGDIHATGDINAGVGGSDPVTVRHHVHPANGSPPTPGT